MPRSISKKFNAVELYGLRELMVQRDLSRIARYEAEWNRLHPDGPWLADARAADGARLQVAGR